MSQESLSNKIKCRVSDHIAANMLPVGSANPAHRWLGFRSQLELVARAQVYGAVHQIVYPGTFA